MAVNYAEKYSEKVDEAFSISSLTEQAVNKEYDWSGVDTVIVYGAETAGMNDYQMSGLSRYGTPEELGNSKQSMPLTKDRSFTFTIDRRNYNSTMMTQEAGKALARQINQVVIPEVDQYRISVMATNALAENIVTGAVTKANAYETFLEVNSKLDDAKVPTVGRICYVKPSFYSLLKLDNSFIKAGDLSQDMLIKGQIGEVDGVAIIKMPSSYFPEDIDFIITHAVATVSPKKLEDYKIHDNPVGVNGWLVEGRILYDAFVLNNKKCAIGVHKTA